MKTSAAKQAVQEAYDIASEDLTPDEWREFVAFLFDLAERAVADLPSDIASEE